MTPVRRRREGRSGASARVAGSATPLLAIALPLLGSFLVSMDVSVVNAIQPAIGKSFEGVGTAAVSWTITAYAITFAATLVPAGRIADRAGRRRTFTAGLAVFAVGSAVCGAAPDLPVLLIGRVLQGAGAAAAQPASLGLLLAAIPSEQRSVHATRWAGAGAVGIALGPVVGGAINVLVSWRWALLVNVPIVAVGMMLAPHALRETERHPGRSLPDPAGALLLAGAAALIALAISQATTWGLTSPKTEVAGVLGLLLGTVFVARSSRVADPVLQLELLRDRRLAFLTATTSLYAAGFFGLLFSFVLFLTNIWQLSTVEAGLGIVPLAGTVVVLSFRVGHLPARAGFRPPLAVGAALMAIGLATNAALENGHSFQAVWVPILMVIGIGGALVYLLLGAAAVATTPSRDLAAVTAINQCGRQLGAALGVASTVAAVGTHAHSVAHFHLAWLICAAFCALAAVSATALGSETIEYPHRVLLLKRQPGRESCRGIDRHKCRTDDRSRVEGASSR
jgi:EmrB/QacA subfamily drug resistance transporter